MRDHLRAFAKLVMALASLPGVTLANSSTALFGDGILLNVFCKYLVTEYENISVIKSTHLAISNSEQPPP